jgi:hypothetical protein
VPTEECERKNMKDLASANRWLTLTANVGVLVGLIFLAVEVRHAGNATELQTIESVSEGWFRLNELIVSDPELARIVVLGLEYPEALTDVESIQFSMHMTMFTNQFTRIGKHYELGLISEQEYQNSSYELASFYNTPGGRVIIENSPDYFKEASLEFIAQYTDSIPAPELMMGRDPSNLK